MRTQPNPPTPTVLVMRYLRQRQDLGEITASTAVVYGSQLHSFARSLRVPIDRVARRHVLAWLEQPGLSPSYRRDRLSVVRSFLTWCELQRYLDRDPTRGLKPPRQLKRLPRYLTEDETAQLLDALEGDPRAVLAVLLMVQCGLRREEVASVQLGDVDLARRSLGVRGKGGQGHVTRAVYIPDEALEAIRDYLRTISGNTGPLLRSELDPHTGITGGQVYRFVIAGMWAAGVKHFAGDGRSPHALRHTCAQHLVDNGVELRVVQQILGHASLDMSLNYTRGAVTGVAEAMEGRRYRRRARTGPAHRGPGRPKPPRSSVVSKASSA